MRRGRGKGKKQNVTDRGSGDEEKISAYRKRWRPQKPMKDENEGEKEIVSKEEEDTNGSVTSKEDETENVTKEEEIVTREEEDTNGSVTTQEENDVFGGLGTKSSRDDSMKSVASIGFRQNGSRRKNKPRRAVEVLLNVGSFLLLISYTESDFFAQS